MNHDTDSSSRSPCRAPSDSSRSPSATRHRATPFAALLLPLLTAQSAPAQSGAAQSVPTQTDATANKQAVPGYRLEVGQKLVFEGSSKTESPTITILRKHTWTIWVTGKTGTGAWRLVLRRVTEQTLELPNQDDRHSKSTSLGWVDMQPDGRIARNDTIAMGLDPTTILVPLARTAKEVGNGWQRKIPIFDRHYDCRIAARDADTKTMQIDVAVDSPSHRNYERTERFSVTFDRAKGLPARITGSTESTGFSTSKAIETCELKSVSRDSSDWPGKFATEIQVFTTARRDYDHLTFSARTKPEKKDDLLATALEDLKLCRKRLTLKEAQEPMDELIQAHGNRVKYVTSYTKVFAPFLNKPSQAWEAVNLDGEKRSLADYKGKVVILDFWYRGCGWCVRAMPQMNELHEHFKGKPVAVLGVNKDRDLADALFTVKAVGLKYENLHSLEMPKCYGIRGYPTLVVLDQKGVVRDFHVGYSPTLKEEMVKVIDGLLGTGE